ncbi:glycoside hydrolase domain-containing protein [Micromonospora sp. RTGN7]|uniref:glycoside hydrolase domain-containing protein n=1 Tax=Micromonospora sp. RTGN7 TaxID=3016526 RepID=UPI0029FF35BD|nr:glycoside hydrolase domain-containing protein [Micromonospora sp. RTGN7]
MASLAAVIVGAAGMATPTWAAPTEERTVSYRGLRLAVPAHWQVVDLADDPHACVRFDRPTVYLGHPGDEPRCPTDLVGRTAGLVIEPIDAVSAARVTADTAVTVKGRATADTLRSRNDSIQLAVRDAGVLVTAEHTPGTESTVRRILASASLGRGAVPASLDVARAASESATVTPLAASGPQPGTYTGKGFDTCTAPAQSTMNTWRNSSPYRAVGVYISGASRSCTQANLTATWVTNQTNNGWHLIPIELDNQAPCGTRTPKMSYDPATARSQGATRATSAVNAAKALGIPAGSAIYNDIEQYPAGESCKAAVLSYLSGWTERLHTLGYLSGMYSSGSSGVRDLCAAYNDTRYTRVDHLFLGWWNGVADTDAGSYCPDGYYANRQRIHQYTGDTSETWGGVQIYIDRDYLDVSTGTPPPSQDFSVTIDNTTSGRFTASANWGTSAYSSQRTGPDYRYASPAAVSDAAWYNATLPETGSYEVSVWYPAVAGYNTSTPYVVATTTGNQTVRVDQSVNGGRWVSLGVFTLAAGAGDKVGVSRWTSTTGYVIADAVRITRI